VVVFLKLIQGQKEAGRRGGRGSKPRGKEKPTVKNGGKGGQRKRLEEKKTNCLRWIFNRGWEKGYGKIAIKKNIETRNNQKKWKGKGE